MNLFNLIFFPAPQIKCMANFKIIISNEPSWSRIGPTYRISEDEWFFLYRFFIFPRMF